MMKARARKRSVRKCNFDANYVANNRLKEGAFPKHKLFYENTGSCSSFSSNRVLLPNKRHYSYRNQIGGEDFSKCRRKAECP